MKIKFIKIEMLALIMALVPLTLAACSNSTTPSSSAASSLQSETTPPPSSNSISSSTPSSAGSSSGASSSEAPPSSSSQSEASQQQSSVSSEASLSSSIQSEVSQQQSSASAKEESTTSSKTTELAGFVKDEEYNLYSKIVSCSIENDIMTVVFSAYAENPVNVEVLMDAWLSDDNGAGQVIETYYIDKLKEYSVSMPSSWFNENDARGRLYMVNVYIITPTSTVTTHSFHYRDGKMS